MTSSPSEVGRPRAQRAPAHPPPWGVGPDWATQRLRQPGWLLLPLRLFLGATFTFAGLQKLANPDFLNPSSPTSVQHQMALVAPTSPIGPLVQLSLHAGPLVGVLIALGELAVGIGTLLGLRARLAAAGGALLALSFFLTVSWTTSPYYYGADIVFLFAWTPFVTLGAAGVLSIDAWLAWRARTSLPLPGAGPGAAGRERQRRAVVAAGTATLTLAAVAAVAGRVFGGAARTARTSARRSPKTHPSRNRSTPAAGSAPPHTPAGTELARTAQVPVGQARAFTDPVSGAPAWVVCLAPGTYAAFSAVCTHAGCTVSYQAAGREFVCPCHGGTYSASNGQVLSGPPPAPLPPIAVKASGGRIYRT